MSDQFDRYRNTSGEHTYDGLYNAGRDQHQQGHRLTPQQWNEPRREYEIRETGYNDQRR